MPKFVQNIIKRIRRLITSPVGELTRAQRTGRFALELGMHCARALRHDRASEMAAALTYRTIFSLIPMFVMVLLVFRGFGGFDNVRTDLEHRIYDYFGLTNIAQTASVETPDNDIDPEKSSKDNEKQGTKSNGDDQKYGKDEGKQNTKGSDPSGKQASPDSKKGESQGPATPGATKANPGKGTSTKDAQPNAPPIASANPDNNAKTETDLDASTAKRQRAEGLISFMKDISEKAANIDAKSIGAFGLILFIWAALALAVELERSFNRVFNCHVGRAWHHRIPIYWAVMTLGPVLIWMSLSVAGKLMSSIEGITFLSWIARFGSSMAALGASWLLLFLLFKLMPNTSVKVRPALIGSLVAAVLWEGAKQGFGLYVSRAVSYSAIYGTLGLFPLFLLWLYLSWLIVLFGLEITYTLQAMKGRKFKYTTSTQQNPMIDPQWVLPISAQIARSFEQGQSLNSRGIAEQLNLPIKAVSHLVAELEKAGYVNRLSHDGEGEAPVSLSRPPGGITIESLLELSSSLRVNTDRHRRRPEWQLLRELSDAELESVKGQTMADLLSRTPAEEVEDNESDEDPEETQAEAMIQHP